MILVFYSLFCYYCLEVGLWLGCVMRGVLGTSIRLFFCCLYYWIFSIWIVYSCSIYDIFAILTTSDSSNISLFLELWVNQQLEFFFFLIHAAEFLLIRIALIIEQFQTYLGSKINTLILPNFHNVVAFPDKGD